MNPDTNGKMIEKAREFERNGEFSKAFLLYSKASESGDRESRLKVGRMLIQGKGCIKQPIKGYSIIRDASIEHDAQSDYELGRCHFEGTGTEKNEDLGFQMIVEAAENGYTPAENYLGRLFMDGRYVEKDPQKGMEWIKRTADKDDPEGLYQIAMEYKDYSMDYDPKKLIELLDRPASLGNADAEYFLGKRYFYGKDVEIDYDKARRLLTNALKHGNYEAGIELGLIYREGYGVPVDPDMARKCFTKAAVNGITKGMYYLGGLYDVNRYLRNPHRAFIWLKRGYDKGDLMCGEKVADLYRTGTGVKKNMEKAFRLYMDCAEHGLVGSMEYVGYCYEKGEGTTHDANKAFDWYTRASEKGSGYAYMRIGMMFVREKDDEFAIKSFKLAIDEKEYRAATLLGELYEKEGKFHSMAQAIFYFRLGAGNDVDMSMVKLADHYDSGAYLEQSYEKAFELYKRVADRSGEHEAAANVGRYYENGYFVERDPKKAMEYYLIAAKGNNAFAMNRLYNILSKSEDPLDQKEAVFWLMRSAAKDSRESIIELAERYLTGRGVPRSKFAATTWFHEAASGNEYARKRFESLAFEENDEDPEYRSKAAMLERRAGEMTENKAITELAELYKDGDGDTEKDLPLAERWYAIADRLGCPFAKERLEKIRKMMIAE